MEDNTPETDLAGTNAPQPGNMIVSIPRVGNVHFPDHMSMDEVHAASKKLHDDAFDEAQQKANQAAAKKANPKKAVNAPVPHVPAPVHEKEPRVFPVDPDDPEVVPLDDTYLPYRPEKPRQPKPLDDVVVGKGDGKTFANPNNVKPLSDTESPARVIPAAGTSGENPSIPGTSRFNSFNGGYSAGGPDATEALQERGEMREGWDDNPKDKQDIQEIMDDPKVWKEEDENLVRSRLRTISSKTPDKRLDDALDNYDRASSAAKPQLEKQIYQKIIDYRRYAKGMDGNMREAMDKKIADYSNALAKKQKK